MSGYGTDLLKCALTHSSHDRAIGKVQQRLEFLGDACLDLLVATELFERFPDANEGFMSVLRAEIVCERAMASLFDKAGYELICGKFCVPTVRLRADAMEAVFGAVYEESRLEGVRRLAIELGMFNNLPGVH